MTRRQNYGVNNAQTQNKIVDVLSLTNSLLPRAYNTDAKTNEVTSQNEKRQEKNQLVFLYKDRIG